MEKHGKYANVVLGGTFDHLHLGHMRFLDEAFRQGRHVYIGLSTDALVHGKPFSESIEPYADRLSALEAYLAKRHVTQRTTIFPLQDIFGNTLKERNLNMILVTSRTLANARAVNRARRRLGWPPLKTAVFGLVQGAGGRTISATNIRSGQMDRSGRLYRSAYAGSRRLRLPPEMRSRFRKPIGKVFAGTDAQCIPVARQVIAFVKHKQPPLTIAVGDIINRSLLDAGFMPDIAVIDRKSRRRRIALVPGLHASSVHLNSAGTLAASAAEALRRTICQFLGGGRRRFIVIRGEEDLMVIAAVLHAPLQAVVIYGQRDLGAVAVLVNERTKKEMVKYLDRFRRE